MLELDMDRRPYLVAGATGYVGRAVVGELVADGERAVAHVRPDSERRAAWRERFEAIGAEVDETPWEREAIHATIARLRPTVVFALLGTTRSRGREAAKHGGAESYETVDYGLTALLIDALRTQAPDARFVYLSSMGVGPEARGAYLQARLRVEQELKQSGLDHVIARPSFITGPGRDDRRPLERGAAALLDVALGALALFGARRTRERYRSTTNTRLARALVRLARDPEMVDTVVEAEGLRG